MILYCNTARLIDSYCYASARDQPDDEGEQRLADLSIDDPRLSDEEMTRFHVALHFGVGGDDTEVRWISQDDLDEILYGEMW